MFYKKIEKLLDKAPKNTIRIVIVNWNIKIGKEIAFVPTIGQQSLHESSNDNGQRLITVDDWDNMIEEHKN